MKSAWVNSFFFFFFFFFFKKEEKQKERLYNGRQKPHNEIEIVFTRDSDNETKNIQTENKCIGIKMDSHNSRS